VHRGTVPVTPLGSDGQVAGAGGDTLADHLPEDLYFRLRMLAYQRGQRLSECAAGVLDEALPKWNVDRIG
jgi:hypothetical protein